MGPDLKIFSQMESIEDPVIIIKGRVMHLDMVMGSIMKPILTLLTYFNRCLEQTSFRRLICKGEDIKGHIGIRELIMRIMDNPNRVF